MKKLVTLCVLVATMAACKGSTEYGKCVGFQSDEEAGLKYEIDTRNAIVTAIFSAAIVWPVIWGLSYAKCPVAKK